ncbi:MAG: Uncharacterised protein [Synechococcus sp. CC9902]|nr:MAG: Uncharacterised protein [Synechococcus sp. CC9902]
MLELAHHLGTVVAAPIEGIATVLEEFGAGHVQSQRNLFAWLVAGLGDRLHQDFTGLNVAQVGSETTFIAH